MKDEELLKLARETNKTYVKNDGVFYLKLSDGRLWCPSAQARGTHYDYKELSLKSLQDQNFDRNSFIAIDFELAYDNKKEAKRFPCQLGIAIVREGKIIDSHAYLIRPPHNKWSAHDLKWHQDNTSLTPQLTENAQEFDQLWDEIKPLFENQFLIAHQAKGVEIDILEKCLDYYQIPYPCIKGYLCTHELLKTGNKNNKLNDLCTRYYIDFDEKMHHDAEQDAIACAKLFIAHLNGVTPMSMEKYNNIKNMPGFLNFADEPNLLKQKEDFEHIDSIPSSKPSTKDVKTSIDLNVMNTEPSTISTVLNGDNILPEFAVSEKLKGKTIVLTGDFELKINQKEVLFSHEDRTKIIKPWLESLGAKVTSSISGKTDIVICGNKPGKQEKIQEEISKGHNIEVLDLSVLNSIIAECENIEKNTDTHNPLYGRRIAIIGEYSLEQEKQIRYEFHKRGAIMNSKKDNKYIVSRTTHYCIIGKNTPQADINKLIDFEYDGYFIKKIPIEEYTKLFNQNLGEYKTEKEIKRNLRITKKYLTYERFRPKSSGNNPYYEKEIFVGANLKGDFSVFSQLIGNIGGYANTDFSEETQMILFSDDSVIHLLNDKPDSTAKKIEDTYNASTDSLGFFNYLITTESNLLDWIADRCEKSHDELTLDLLKTYKKTIIEPD